MLANRHWNGILAKDGADVKVVGERTFSVSRFFCILNDMQTRQIMTHHLDEYYPCPPSHIQIVQWKNADYLLVFGSETLF